MIWHGAAWLQQKICVAPTRTLRSKCASRACWHQMARCVRGWVYGNGGDKKGVAGKRKLDLILVIRHFGSDEGSPVSRAFLPRNEGAPKRQRSATTTATKKKRTTPA